MCNPAVHVDYIYVVAHGHVFMGLGYYKEQAPKEQEAKQQAPKEQESSLASVMDGHGTFIPSPSFVGLKPGYTFGTGQQGLGYYKEQARLRTCPYPHRHTAPTTPGLVPFDRLSAVLTIRSKSECSLAHLWSWRESL